MTQYTKVFPYISEQIPDFIRANNPLLVSFMEAYYEYLEKVNDSETTTRLTAYKKLGNANNLIQGQTENRDIDKTIVKFLEYFKRDILPIAVVPKGSDDRFLIKKIRDVYLSKGTPNSFKLLFRLLFNTEIDVIQPGQQILDASEGNYVSFDTLALLVNDSDKVLNNIDFSKTSIIKDDSEIGTGLSGTKVNTIGSKSVVQLISAAALNLTVGSEIVVSSTIDNSNFITGTVLRQMKSIKIDDSDIGGYSAGDEVRIIQNNREFSVPIEGLQAGSVTGATVKNRGIDFVVGDAITFTSKSSGSGGSAIITGVDNAGRITEIDNNNVRLGQLGTGFLANDFQNVTVPINEGGTFNELPDVKILSLNGTNAEIVPFSDQIGKINNFSFFNKGYFDSDGVDVIFPMNVTVHGQSDLTEGQTVRIQRFEADSDGFDDDSDSFRISVKFTNRKFTTNDSEDIRVRIPYKFDFENYQWVDSEFKFSHTIGENLSKSFRTLLQNQIGSDSTYRFDVIDSDDKGNRDSESLRIFLQDPRLKGLDNFHFDQLASYEDSDKYRQISFKQLKNTPFVGLNDSVGRFQDTNFIGKITSVTANKNVVKLTQAPRIVSTDRFPIDSDLSVIENQRYKVLRLAPVDTETNETVVSETFPYKNIIANHQRATGTLSFEGSGKTSKQFLDDKGFSNSLSGGVIRDNLFFDNFSYSLKSNLSIAQWREYVKEILHPAGFRLLAQLNINSTVSDTSNKTSSGYDAGEQHKMTFDRSMDHSINATTSANLLTASSVLYASNPFNFFNISTPDGRSISADNLSSVAEEGDDAEFGNSFWDYEPLGYIDPRSTQTKDSDGSINVHEKTFTTKLYPDVNLDSEHYQDYFKNKTLDRFPDEKIIEIGQTTFPAGENNFLLFDSEKVNRIKFIRFDYLNDSDGRYSNDSDDKHLFKGINYQKLKDNDSDIVKQNITKRDFEYNLEMQKDFIKANKLNNEFSFNIGSQELFDLEAFQQKWNTIHVARVNKEGWEIAGWSSAIQNAADGHKVRQFYYPLNNIPQYAKEKNPVKRDFWVKPNNIVWTNTYLDPLNKTELNLLEGDSDYRSPSQYYKTRTD